jgi:integrase
MASIYKPSYTRKDPATGERVKRFSRKYYVEYRDASGRVRRVPGYTDKRATEQLAAQLEKEAARGEVGLTPHGKHRRKPLSSHLADYRKVLQIKDDDPKHVRQTERAIISTLTASGAEFPADLNRERLESALARIRREGKSARTYNYHLTAVRGFFRWMVRQHRLDHNPLDHLAKLNVETDQRRVRRVIDQAQLADLIGATAAGKAFRGLEPADRVILYQVAAFTGLRCGELSSLTPESFALASRPPTVTVPPRRSKRRREDVLPLHPDLAEILGLWLVGKEPRQRVFPGTWHRRAADMLKIDLLSAGIPYTDEQDHVFDFHGLRGTFITNLARAGLHPRVAQQLARHSDINLTMNVYTKLGLSDLADGVRQLPPVPGKKTHLDSGPDK